MGIIVGQPDILSAGNRGQPVTAFPKIICPMDTLTNPARNG